MKVNNLYKNDDSNPVLVEDKSYSLNFSGRIKQSSMKNFQLIEEIDGN